MKNLVASNRVKERILEIPNLVNKEVERLEKVLEISSLGDKMVKDLDKTSKLLSELLEQLKTLKTSYTNLQKLSSKEV